MASAEEDYHEQEFVKQRKVCHRVMNTLLEFARSNYAAPAMAFMFWQAAVMPRGNFSSILWGRCVLRPVKTEGTDWYIFYGEAFVKGQMDGEALDL